MTSDASVAAAAEALDGLDVLINNAAAFVDWTEMGSAADLATARAVLDTNLFGAGALRRRCCHCCMRARIRGS